MYETKSCWGPSEKAVEAHWSPKCCCLDLFPLITGILTAPEVVGPFQKGHCCSWNVVSYFISGVKRLHVLCLSTWGLASQVPCTCTFILRTLSAIEVELTIRPGWLTPVFAFPEYRNASTVACLLGIFIFESLWCLDDTCVEARDNASHLLPTLFFEPGSFETGVDNLADFAGLWSSRIYTCSPCGLELEMQLLHLAFMCSRDPNSGPHAFIAGSLKSEHLPTPSAGF